MPIKVYCERNAMPRWLRELQREGRIVLVWFPYDGHKQDPRGAQRATPSVVTCDSTLVTCDSTIPISEMVGSQRLDDIRRIIRRPNEKVVQAPAGLIGMHTEGDARHLDSAYKSACQAFITADKGDILEHAAELELLLGFRLFHPDDEERFRAFVDATLQATLPSAPH